MLDVITLIKHGLDRISIARGGALYRKHRKTREHDTVRHAGRVTPSVGRKVRSGDVGGGEKRPSISDEQRSGGSTGDVDVGKEASVRLGVWAVREGISGAYTPVNDSHQLVPDTVSSWRATARRGGARCTERVASLTCTGVAGKILMGGEGARCGTKTAA
ncbi:hypothetical protein GGX14DRAFT_404558 [Mycena pura]|uniref:Uncharacterized protein n=1 Tax=Mycena pura TaxID=153505 RepID=A0AAD6UXK5_9AGAR|nr:hypothetical protein GGX14DRAFT_404558 [Mycena pura]